MGLKTWNCGKKCSWKEGATDSQGDGYYRILLPFFSLPRPTYLHSKEQFGQKLLNSCWDIVRKVEEIIKILTHLTETRDKNLAMLEFMTFFSRIWLLKKDLLRENLTISNFFFHTFSDFSKISLVSSALRLPWGRTVL